MILEGELTKAREHPPLLKPSKGEMLGLGIPLWDPKVTLSW